MNQKCPRCGTSNTYVYESFIDFKCTNTECINFDLKTAELRQKDIDNIRPEPEMEENKEMMDWAVFARSINQNP